MRRRGISGIIGSVLLILSSAAHALVGWPAVSTAITATNAGAELRTDVTIGWLFGSVAMLAFGLIVLAYGVRLLRGRDTDRWPPMVIGVCYLLFGVAAFVWTQYNPHFIGFIVIGAIVSSAAIGKNKSSSTLTR